MLLRNICATGVQSGGLIVLQLGAILFAANSRYQGCKRRRTGSLEDLTMILTCRYERDAEQGCGHAMFGDCWKFEYHNLLPRDKLLYSKNGRDQ